MAEAVVCLVVDYLIPLLVQEANLLAGIHGEVDDIKNELESIQAFLKDADNKAETEANGGDVKPWVKQLREAAYKIEDVIDKYILHTIGQVQLRHADWLVVRGFIRKVTCWVGELRPRSSIAYEIQQIKVTIQRIKENGHNYGFRALQHQISRVASNPSQHDPRVSSLFIEDADVVGIEPSRDKLISWLVNGESKRTVVSLVGMGGLGKTTLAKKVYDSEIISSHFYCQAWITVSQSYRPEELLRTTLKQFYKARKEFPPVEIYELDVVMLIEWLRKYLEPKSYLVAFDDVWSLEFWELIRCAVPDKGQGSRVLITTRKEDVALKCKESPFDHIYKLQPLPKCQALKLFSKKVFHSDTIESSPSELKEISKSIVQRCEGLPLAIVTLGGMLATRRKSLSDWQKLECTLSAELFPGRRLENVTKILSYSFFDLPYYLKSCFMYFGMLPEDYSIRHARLLRLWIAEGFVKPTRGKTPEQVAEEYLIELIHRNMVQVSRIDVDGKVRTCKVHDLMRGLILSKSEEWSYCQVWENGVPSFYGGTRRISIHRCMGEDAPTRISNIRIRSVSLFLVNEMRSSYLRTMAKLFKLLKVLDLAEAPMEFLPEEVGDLFHLRYLSVRHTNTKMLPRSVGRLHNLLTLDVKCSLIHELPSGIEKLHKLQYLLGYVYDYETDFSITSQRGLKFKKGIGSLKCLLKLYLVEVKDRVDLIRELRELKQLRKLGITQLPQEYGKELCDSISLMGDLESLEVCSIGEDETIDLESISPPPKFLQRLYLKGRLEKVPDWIPMLENLDSVSLMWSGFQIDPLHALCNLPNLKELILQKAYLGERLTFLDSGFQKLKILKLYDMDTLTELILEEGALPILELLKIGPIPMLKTIPSGIRHLRKLTALRFYDVPNEFAFRLLPEEGQDFWIIQHVRTVLFHYQLRGERYKTRTLSDLSSM